MISFISTLVMTLVLVTSQAYGSEAVKGAKKDYETFKMEMSQKLESVEQRIADLKSKAKEKGSATQDEAIKDLEKTKSELKTQLNSAKESSNETWSNFKKRFATSVDNLNSKIQNALKDN